MFENKEAFLSLDSKDIYLCIKQSALSSMVGPNPPRDEGDIDILSAVGSVLRLFHQNNNLELWWEMREFQEEELSLLCIPSSDIDHKLDEIDDEQLLLAAQKLKRYNPDLIDKELDYVEQLNNLERIDNIIIERQLIRAKRMAAFIAQVIPFIFQ